jgi:hypothetical protein
MSKNTVFIDRFEVYVDPSERKVTQVPVRKANAHADSCPVQENCKFYICNLAGFR